MEDSISLISKYSKMKRQFVVGIEESKESAKEFAICKKQMRGVGFTFFIGTLLLTSETPHTYFSYF